MFSRRLNKGVPLWETEPFMLNCGQTFLTIRAKVYDKLQ
jgi:hypothetical protein